jgi:hypothetical protein
MLPTGTYLVRIGAKQRGQRGKWFPLTSGKREALITNVEKGKIEAAMFPELYKSR